MHDEFDVVIVGSGPAGCALARSLLEHSAGLTLAILEEAPEVQAHCPLLCGDGAAAS